MCFMLVHRRFVIVCLLQMCFLFTPPQNIVNVLPPNVKLPTHLELFQLLMPAPDPNHCMYKVSWLSVQLNTQYSAFVIQVHEILHWNIHLYPKSEHSPCLIGPVTMYWSCGLNFAPIHTTRCMYYCTISINSSPWPDFQKIRASDH